MQVSLLMNEYSVWMVMSWIAEKHILRCSSVNDIFFTNSALEAGNEAQKFE